MADLALRELTQAELAAYETDGVVCARGLFPDAWIDRMASAVDRIVANPTFFGNVVSMRDQNFTGDLFVWKVDDDFRDWVYESPAARIAQQILGCERICHFYDQLFVKPVGCHVPTPWHQDITFWPVDVECRSICSIWITFDPVDRASSGLEFVKGSHRWPQRFKAVTPNYDPFMLDSDFDDPPDIDNHREDYDLYCPDMNPGDCLIFNPHVMHGSSSNYSTDTARRALSSRWSGEGVTYEDRRATMPLLWEHGLETGDPIGGSLFPQILPHPIAAEGARRALGPQPPEPETVAAVMGAIANRSASASAK